MDTITNTNSETRAVIYLLGCISIILIPILSYSFEYWREWFKLTPEEKSAEQREVDEERNR